MKLRNAFDDKNSNILVRTLLGSMTNYQSNINGSKKVNRLYINAQIHKYIHDMLVTQDAAVFSV